jgi:cell pole-organizing protein PopZ
MASNDPKATAANGADPSMEDILASIRKILNEDEQQGAPADEEPLELTEAMLVEAASEPAADPAPLAAETPPPTAADAQHAPPEHPVPEQVAPEHPPPAAPEPAAPIMTADSPADRLITPSAAAAAAASLGLLSRTVAEERATAVTRGGPSIEDVVREELRPLLKAWLDTHLPPLVERLVRAEIERVRGP